MKTIILIGIVTLSVFLYLMWVVDSAYSAEIDCKSLLVECRGLIASKDLNASCFQMYVSCEQSNAINKIADGGLR